MWCCLFNGDAFNEHVGQLIIVCSLAPSDSKYVYSIVRYVKDEVPKDANAGHWEDQNGDRVIFLGRLLYWKSFL